MTGSLRRYAVGLAIVLALGACGSSEDDPLAGLGQGDSSAQEPAGGTESTMASETSEGSETSEPQVAVDVTSSAGGTLVATATTSSVAAFSGPDGDEVVAEFDNPVETGGPLVFQVLGEAGGDRIEVLLPIRPNGSTGWIAADDVELASTPYRVEVDVSDYELTVFEGEEARIVTPVGIGTGDTPTPVGAFYLYELLQPPDPDGPYGSHAYGLSGFSETLESFNGGDGVIGIHGTNDPGSLGTDVSHGCIRVANEVIDDMVSFLPLGTPVTINP